MVQKKQMILVQKKHAEEANDVVPPIWVREKGSQRLGASSQPFPGSLLPALPLGRATLVKIASWLAALYYSRTTLTSFEDLVLAAIHASSGDRRDRGSPCFISPHLTLGGGSHVNECIERFR